MNILDKFRYSKDDPSQLNISLKKDPYEKVNNSNINNLNQDITINHDKIILNHVRFTLNSS